MPKIFIRQCIKGQSESLRNIPKTFFLGCCCNLMLLDGIQKALFLLLKVSGQMMLVFFDIILCLVMDFSALDWKHSCCCCCCSANIWMHLSIWLRIALFHFWNCGPCASTFWWLWIKFTPFVELYWVVFCGQDLSLVWFH